MVPGRVEGVSHCVGHEGLRTEVRQGISAFEGFELEAAIIAGIAASHGTALLIEWVA
jgi:hypothetical protein